MSRSIELPVDLAERLSKHYAVAKLGIRLHSEVLSDRYALIGAYDNIPPSSLHTKSAGSIRQKANIIASFMTYQQPQFYAAKEFLGTLDQYSDAAWPRDRVQVLSGIYTEEMAEQNRIPNVQPGILYALTTTFRPNHADPALPYTCISSLEQLEQALDISPRNVLSESSLLANVTALLKAKYDGKYVDFLRPAKLPIVKTKKIIDPSQHYKVIAANDDTFRTA